MKNATTTQKAAKRPYIKKRLRTQDELWKAIVPELWAHFLRFCLEDWADKIDFTHKPDFLNKELKRLMLRSKAKNRTVDFLMRIYLKDGTTKFFLLHIEVQGYPDADFRKRVFQYYYRIGDLLDEDVETLVVMIDDDPDNRPNEYRKDFGQTSVYFKFRMFKLSDNPPPYKGKEDNLFSIVFEVAWYGLKENMLNNDDDLMTLKFRLIKQLLTNDIPSTTIYTLLDFINIYLPFGKKEKERIFDRKIESFIDKEKNMEALTIREIYGRKIREDERRIVKNEMRQELRRDRKKAEKEALLREEAQAKRKEAETQRKEAETQRQEEAKLRQEEAKLRQEAEAKLASAVRKLHSQGTPLENIADIMSLSVDYVKEIIDKK